MREIVLFLCLFSSVFASEKINNGIIRAIGFDLDQVKSMSLTMECKTSFYSCGSAKREFALSKKTGEFSVKTPKPRFLENTASNPAVFFGLKVRFQTGESAETAVENGRYFMQETLNTNDVRLYGIKVPSAFTLNKIGEKTIQQLLDERGLKNAVACIELRGMEKNVSSSSTKDQIERVFDKICVRNYRGQELDFTKNRPLIALDSDTARWQILEETFKFTLSLKEKMKDRRFIYVNLDLLTNLIDLN